MKISGFFHSTCIYGDRNHQIHVFLVIAIINYSKIPNPLSKVPQDPATKNSPAAKAAPTQGPKIGTQA